MVDVVGAEETEVVVEVVSVEVAGVATQVSVVVAGVAIRATAVVEVGIPEEVLEEVVETLEVEEASTAVVDEGAVGVADPENREGTRSFFSIFSPHLIRSAASSSRTFQLPWTLALRTSPKTIL